MKLKDSYYSQQGWEQKITSLGSWLRMKDDFYRHHTALMHHFGVKLQPKHRHPRTVTIRNLRKIYGYTTTDLYNQQNYLEFFEFGLNISVEQSTKRRLWVYREYKRS